MSVCETRLQQARSGSDGTPRTIRSRLSIALLAILITATRAPAEPGTWIDLTHPFDATTIYWPTEKGFEFEAGANGPTAKGSYYAANRFTTAEHGGTHLDAPRHFSATGQTSDAIPVERLVGDAAVIDVAAKCASHEDRRR